METIDARGRSCPEPVMMARAALTGSADGIDILVDDPCAVENLSRFAANGGYSAAVDEEKGCWRLALRRK